MNCNCNDCNCNKQADKTIVECLQDEMNKSGHISDDAVCLIAKKLNKPLAQVYGVLTFYSQFKRMPSAKYTIDVCTGTACFILGADSIVEKLKQKLGINVFEVTPDKKFGLFTVRCLGCCALAPVISINGKQYPKVKPEDIDKILAELD